MQREVMLLQLESIKAHIGKTPFLEIQYPDHAPILAKLEYANLTGSIKDRPAVRMVEHLIESIAVDKLEGLDLLDYSGGNMGRSLAVICQKLGWNFHLATLSNCSPDLRSDFDELGVRLYFAEGKGFWSVMELARSIKELNPAFCFLNQTYNKENFRAHYYGTGAEILWDLQGRVPYAWVASAGSGGTFSGVFQRLREAFPHIHGHLVMPAEQPYGDHEAPNSMAKFQGSGGLGAGRKQPFLQEVEAHIKEFWTYSYDEALEECRNFYLERGIAIGTSAAANLLAARKIAKVAPKNQVVTTVFASLANATERAFILK